MNALLKYSQIAPFIDAEKQKQREKRGAEGEGNRYSKSPDQRLAIVTDLKGCLVLGQPAQASIWLLLARPATALLSRSLDPSWECHRYLVWSLFLFAVVSPLLEQETKGSAEDEHGWKAFRPPFLARTLGFFWALSHDSPPSKYNSKAPSLMSRSEEPLSVIVCSSVCQFREGQRGWRKAVEGYLLFSNV